MFQLSISANVCAIFRALPWLQYRYNIKGLGLRLNGQESTPASGKLPSKWQPGVWNPRDMMIKVKVGHLVTWETFLLIYNSSVNTFEYWKFVTISVQIKHRIIV